MNLAEKIVIDKKSDKELVEEFRKKYPGLLPDEINTVEQALLNSTLGKLIKAFSFNLKGTSSDVAQSIKTFTRIESPNEILKGETPRGRFLLKRYEKINSQFEALYSEAVKKKTDDKIFLFTYHDDRLSLTKNVANELIAGFPDKVIVLGREKDDEYRCSLRSGKNVELAQILAKALVGIEGHGGGHEQACGAAIKKHNFERFLENMRRELENV